MSEFNCRIRNAPPVVEDNTEYIPSSMHDATGMMIVSVGDVMVDSGCIGIVDPCYAGWFDRFAAVFHVPGDGTYPVLGVYLNGRLVEIRLQVHQGWEELCR